MNYTQCISAAVIALSLPVLPCLAASDTECGPYSQAVQVRSLVFSGGDGVSKFYRIPAIAVAPDGSLVAVADRRLDSNKDLPGRIDVVARRSTDGGASWGPTIEIALNDSTGGYGDPAIGLSTEGELVVVMTHGNGLWESSRDNHASIFASRSSDCGLTWSEPYNISGNVFDSDGSAPVDCVGAFATSGRIETLDDGRMMFALVVRHHERKWSELSVYPVESRDGGRSWRAVPVEVDVDGDESKLVQLSDGSLLMSVRNRHKGGRKFARSMDGGATWWAISTSSTLPDPACNGDIVTYEFRGREYLLHSIPDSKTARRDVSIFASADAGESWRKLITVCPVGSAYSALAVLPDGTLGCFSEEASSLGGWRLWFSRIDIASLIRKTGL